MEKRSEISIEGMTCAACVKRVQKSLKKNPGVIEASVHFATNKAVVTYDPRMVSEEAILASIHESGYEGEILDEAHLRRMPDINEEVHFKKFVAAALLTLPLMLDMIGMFFGLEHPVPYWIQAVFATAVQFWCGWTFYKGTYYSLKALSANMDVLIALGTSAAYGFSLFVWFFALDEPLYFEIGAMIITLILLGRWMEVRSKRRATSAIRKLLDLQPRTAQVRRDGQFAGLPVEEVCHGDIFMVRPGDSIAVDGIVREGESAVDESTLTGESIPVYKGPGSEVFAGTLNANGSLIVEATGIGSETILSRMVKLVQEAQDSRAPVQHLADKISEVFVPVVIMISAATFMGWALFGAGSAEALINAVAVLVIACPCALGLATPTVIVVATGRAAEVGVLFKDAKAFETVQKMDVLIVDKTGTLTRGQPMVQEVVAESGSRSGDVLQIAASLAHRSSHPLSEAIVGLAQRSHLPLEPVHEFDSFAGRGIAGTKRGVKCALGSARFAKENGISFDDLRVEKWQEDGKNAVIVWKEEKVLGYIVIEDEIRDTTPRAVELLQKMKIPLLMITGDSLHTAAAVSSRLGIEQYLAEVLPDEKAKKVQEVKDSGMVVGMVGDGVNDAPALATAHVGFAIDYGSDVAIEAADITLLGGDLMGVVKAIDLSKTTYRKIRENLFFAFIYNILAIPFAAFGLLNPVIAAAAMAASSLSVVGNALLLKRWTPKR